MGREKSLVTGDSLPAAEMIQETHGVLFSRYLLLRLLGSDRLTTHQTRLPLCLFTLPDLHGSRGGMCLILGIWAEAIHSTSGHSPNHPPQHPISSSNAAWMQRIQGPREAWVPASPHGSHPPSTGSELLHELEILF